MGEVKNSINQELNNISNARLGVQVRSSIHDAIEKIADTIDENLEDWGSRISSAESAALSAASNFTSAQSMVNTAVEAAAGITDMTAGLEDMYENISVGSVNYNAYEQQNGSSVWNISNPTVSFDRNTHTFNFDLPTPPKFRSVSVSMLSAGTTPTASYNPNTGSITLGIPYAHKAVSAVAETVLANPSTGAAGNAGVSYDALNNRYTFRIPQGAKGDGVLQQESWFATRPYIRKLMDFTTSTGVHPIPTNGSFFSRQSVLNRSDLENYDMLAIVFRKSADNYSSTSSQLNKIGSNPGQTTKLTDNARAEATTVVFLPKYGQALAEIDIGGTRYCREVRWLSENLSYYVVHKVVKQVIKLDSVKIVPASMDSYWFSVSTYHQTNEVFDGGVYFGDAFIGNRTTLATSDTIPLTGTGCVGDLTVNVNNTKKNNRLLDPPYKYDDKKKNQNLDYNQFMLPLAIYGIRFNMPQSTITALEG